MKVEFSHNQKKYYANLSQPIDLSIPFENENGVKCFEAPDVQFTPFEMDGFIGSVNRGSAVNYYDAFLNPHGNGTHTECLGHLTTAQESVNQLMKQFHFVAELITLKPEWIEGDFIFTESILKRNFTNSNHVQSLIIRTLPNSEDKLVRNYTATNPPYFSKEAIQYLVRCGISHLLVDLPSIDKEDDGGALHGHKAFWEIGRTHPRKNATITELIYVPNEVQDGLYFLNLQIAPFELDASPSKPLIYKLSTNE